MRMQREHKGGPAGTRAVSSIAHEGTVTKQVYSSSLSEPVGVQHVATQTL